MAHFLIVMLLCGLIPLHVTGGLCEHMHMAEVRAHHFRDQVLTSSSLSLGSLSLGETSYRTVRMGLQRCGGVRVERS